MTRIDHRNHNHPNTTAARTACRNEIREAHARIDAYYAAFPVDLGPDPRKPVIVTKDFYSGIGVRTGKRIKHHKVVVR
jgi:hypothetical protein